VLTQSQEGEETIPIRNHPSPHPVVSVASLWEKRRWWLSVWAVWPVQKQTRADVGAASDVDAPEHAPAAVARLRPVTVGATTFPRATEAAARQLMAEVTTMTVPQTATSPPDTFEIETTETASEGMTGAKRLPVATIRASSVPVVTGRSMNLEGRNVTAPHPNPPRKSALPPKTTVAPRR